MWRSLLLAGITWLAVACNVATVDQAPSTIVRNQCSSDDECAGGVCQGDQCRSRNGSLHSLLFEVTPPADGSGIAGVQFLQPVTDLKSAGGTIALDLQSIAQVTGKITVDRTCMPNLIADDRSLSVGVTFSPASSALGLYSPRTVVQSALRQIATADPDHPTTTSWGFSLNVPPGKYDIYVEPRQETSVNCPVPPQLVRGYQINGGGALGFEIALPEPTPFQLHVTWPPADSALGDWVADMLDPVSGRVISNQVELALGSASKKDDYVATLYYSPVAGETNGAAGNELIRLSPPKGVVAPTILAQRNVLSLFKQGGGTLVDFTSLPSPVRVTGQVTALATPRPVAASVTLVAYELAGIDPGLLASFVSNVEVADDGQFVVDLLPGKYRVSAVPRTEVNAEAKLASVTTEWEIASSPTTQAGKVIELGQALPVTGRALDASGATAMATALVQAVPSASSIQVDVLHQSLGESLYVPRSSSASVNAAGDFALNTDPGKYDITVRPVAETGFGWLVLPSVPIGTLDKNSAGLNLDRLRVPLSVLYRGTVTVPGEPMALPVPGALLRAYAYVAGGAATDDPTKADSVLQVGEARADSKGNFDILIPASLNDTFTAK